MYGKILKVSNNYARRMEGVPSSEKIKVFKEEVEGVTCRIVQEYSEWEKCRQGEVEAYANEPTERSL